MSKETMRKDFIKLADERLFKFASDMIAIYGMANIAEHEAATDIVYSLLKALAKMIVWGNLNPSPNELQMVLEEIIRVAKKKLEKEK